MKRLAIAAVLSLVTVTAPARAQVELAVVDGPAPMFRLPVYNPKPVGATVVGLERYVGPDAAEKNVRVLLLSFMASFCEPCKKEMPYLQFLHERYSDLGLRVVSVSIDAEPEGQKIVEELIAEHKVTYPVLKDRFNLVARRWLGNQSPLPSVFLVRRDATVSKIHRGYDDDIGTVLAAEIESALGIKRLGAPPMPPPAAKATPAAEAGAGVVQPAGGSSAVTPVKDGARPPDTKPAP